MCQHNKLIAADNFTGIGIDEKNETGEILPSGSQIRGMFTYKKYKCEDCGRIITVLNAIVEEIKNV